MSEDFQKEFVHIASDKFPVQPGEDEEIVNEGLYGQALSQYLVKEMAIIGYETSFFVSEDWGWWVSIRKDKFKSGICIYCTSHPPALKTYAVCDADHGFTNRKDEILKLRADLLSVFQNDPDIDVKGITDDAWGPEFL